MMLFLVVLLRPFLPPNANVSRNRKAPEILDPSPSKKSKKTKEKELENLPLAEKLKNAFKTRRGIGWRLRECHDFDPNAKRLTPNQWQLMKLDFKELMTIQETSKTFGVDVGRERKKRNQESSKN